VLRVNIQTSAEIGAYTLLISGGGTVTNPLNQAKTLGSAWTQFSETLTLSSSLTQIGIMIGVTPANTAEATDSVYITGVRINRGSVPAPYIWEYAEELRRCQRYYQKSYAYATIAGTNTTYGLASTLCPSNTVAIGWSYMTLYFSPPFRDVPSVVLYGPAGTANTVGDGNGTDLAASSGLSHANFGTRGSVRLYNGSGGTLTLINQLVQFHWTASAEL